jgi:hypothetical protein
MTTRTTNLADGSVQTVYHVDGDVLTETRRDTGNGFVTITTLRLSDGAITERREQARAKHV